MIDLDELERLANKAKTKIFGTHWLHDTTPFYSAVKPDTVLELINRLREAEKALTAVSDLINHSEGVVGLHLNGDIASWDELRTGGRFEGWLIDFDAAMEKGNEYSANRGRV